MSNFLPLDSTVSGAIYSTCPISISEPLPDNNHPFSDCSVSRTRYPSHPRVSMQSQYSMKVLTPITPRNSPPDTSCREANRHARIGYLIPDTLLILSGSVPLSSHPWICFASTSHHFKATCSALLVTSDLTYQWIEYQPRME